MKKIYYREHGGREEGREMWLLSQPGRLQASHGRARVVCVGEVYEKIPFAWNEPRPVPAVPSRLRFEPVRRGEDDLLSSTILRCVTASLDRADARFAASADPMRAIRDYLTEADVAFDHLAEWRRIARTPAGEIVGFIMSVTFRGCD